MIEPNALEKYILEVADLETEYELKRNEIDIRYFGEIQEREAIEL